MAENPIGSALGGGPGGKGGFLGGLLGGFGGQKRAIADVRGRFKVDVSGVDSITSAFKKATQETSAYRKEIDALTKSLKSLNEEQRKQQPGGGATVGQSARWGSLPVPQSSWGAPNGPAMSGPAGGGMPLVGGGGGVGSMLTGGGGGGGLLSTGGAAGAGAAAIAAAVTKAVDAVASRFQRSQDYALAASQSAVQLTLGGGFGSRQSINDNIRDPLARSYYLGGPDDQGVTSTMSLARQFGSYNQATLNKNATALAAGATSLAIGSGGAVSVDQAQAIMRNAQNPETVATFQGFYGTSIYQQGGGGLKGDPVRVMAQAVIRKFPEFDRKAWARAQVPGSYIRLMLINTGVPEDMIDPIVQYALAQINFTERGGGEKSGSGNSFVDFSSSKDRKLLGITDEHAIAALETNQARTTRDENFYQKQTDNFAHIESIDKTLVEIKGWLENTFSGPLGFVGGNSGIIGKAGRTAAGAGTGAAIGSAIFPGAGTAVGAVLGGTIGFMSGDPTGESGVTFPVGYSGKRGTVQDLQSNTSWSKMSSTMKSRLAQLFVASGGKVGFGGGYRDDAEQERMFRDRYRPDPSGDIEWQGQRWKRVKGAPAAPPGRSMHGAGMAADLVGDMGWLQQNAARFGLKTFANVNNEPWHVQPAELPNSRREWEKQGGKVVGDDGTSMPIEDNGTAATAGSVEVDEHGGAGAGVAPGLFGGIRAALAGVGEASIAAGGSSTDSLAPNSTTSSNPATGATSGSFSTNTQGAMSGADVARVAYNAGFRGDTLVKMVAIAQRESGFVPGIRANDSDDLSYGLWQINMLGSLGPARVKQHGLKSYDDLYDPATNARVAWELSGGGQNLMPWKIGNNPLANTDMTAARGFVQQAGLGDPTGEGMGARASRPQSSGGVFVQGGGVTVNATFHVTVSGGSEQAGEEIARSAAAHLRNEMNLAMTRST